ncbi:DUF3343 domain-containing protein [Anaerococcus sp. AGMB09787]|uniref:DUF3343 domain-containing protein n=1 Tax=Anaerococcus sp. AGMB09787 TaxID=2922869 RepID=UPI001FAE8DF1|nr:DUF3343 domain-containing protein [Anaerococcus sp. AGMB09787]
MDEYLLITFDSTTDAMVSETKVNEAGIKARLVPLLPEIDAGCGLALRVKRDEDERLMEILRGKDLPFKDCYILIYRKNERHPEVKAYDLP